MKHTRAMTAFTYGILIFWSLVVLMPLYWVVITSFKTPVAIGGGATFIPWVDFKPSLHAWRELFFSGTSGWQRYFRNSLIVALGTAAASVIFGMMGGYVLARWPRIGRFQSSQLSFLMLQQRMFPAALLALPILVMFRTLHLLDTLVGLIILYTCFNVPFAVYMLTDFIRSIPVEIEESALIDGCSRLGVIFRITFPLVAPGLVAVFVLVLAFAWNEYFFALVLTFGKSVTVPIFLQNQLNQAENVGWWNVSAIAVVSILPLATAGLLLERYIRRGLTLGAIR